MAAGRHPCIECVQAHLGRMHGRQRPAQSLLVTARAVAAAGVFCICSWLRLSFCCIFVGVTWARLRAIHLSIRVTGEVAVEVQHVAGSPLALCGRGRCNRFALGWR